MVSTCDIYFATCLATYSAASNNVRVPLHYLLFKFENKVISSFCDIFPFLRHRWSLKIGWMEKKNKMKRNIFITSATASTNAIPNWLRNRHLMSTKFNIVLIGLIVMYLAFVKVSSTRCKSGQIWFAALHSILSKASISENVQITK